MPPTRDDSIVEAYIQTDRLRFHYRRHGDPNGLPILFVHGGFATSRWWTTLFELLPDDFCAVAPDMRGCGETDKPTDGYSIESQSEDLAAFVSALALRDFDVVAHAAGGAVAVEYVLSHPGVARSLTLIDSVPIEGVFTPVEALRLLDQMRFDPLLLRQAIGALMPVLAASSNPLFESIVADAASMAPAAFTEVTVALGQWNRMADARRLTLPCLLVWGDADPLVSRDMMTRALLSMPGAANLEVLEGVGHSPMLDAPLTLAERLVGFITEDFSGLAGVRASGFDER